MEILYQDRAVLVVIKPRGVLSEAGREDSVPALLAAEYGTLYPVHRLDRVVGGVMVYARHQHAAAVLSRAVAEGKLKKEYVALLGGVPPAPEGELRDLLFKDAKQNKSFVVTTPRRGAREAILSYRTEAEAIHEGSTVTRVHVGLVTGRSHQIRVQFASRGTPLLGDGKYGSRVKCQYPALFAAGLSFPHPEDGRMMSFSAPVPGDFPWNLFGTSQYEIERKYLIAYPDTEKLGSLSGLHKRAITQTYLRAPVGVTRRVRRSEEEGRVSFVLTEKTRVNATTAVEEERVLSESAYLAELNGRDESRQPIEKTRYAFPFEGHTVEIDVYPFWQDRAILEVELEREDEEILLPSFIRVIREVTADKRYKNVSLAREVPMDEIC